MAKNSSVIGIYPDRTSVSDALDVLHQSGYRATDVAVLLPDNQGTKDFGHEKSTKAPEGAAIGSVAGAAIGAALVWLAATNVLVIPGSSSLLASGPVIATFAGAGAGGASGWLIGLLAGLGKPEYEAKRYAGRIRSGGILLSVHCDNSEWRDKAIKTLRDTGAQHVASAPEAAADYGTTDKPTERAPMGITDRS